MLSYSKVNNLEKTLSLLDSITQLWIVKILIFVSMQTNLQTNEFQTLVQPHRCYLNSNINYSNVNKSLLKYYSTNVLPSATKLRYCRQDPDDSPLLTLLQHQSMPPSSLY